jgi:hypothetical protein
VRRVPLLLLAAAALAGCGSSSPPGLDIVFVSTRDGDYALFGMDADGGHLGRLTKEKGDASSPETLFRSSSRSRLPGRPTGSGSPSRAGATESSTSS